MCTINQIPIEAPVTGYKVCMEFQKKIFGFYYSSYEWSKGENIARSTEKERVQMDQVGFHCFKLLEDARSFMNRLRGGYDYDKVFSGNPVIIKVTLTKNIRQGINDITAPMYDKSPCYVGEVAQWDGEILERRR